MKKQMVVFWTEGVMRIALTPFDKPKEYSICNRTGWCKGHTLGCPCEIYDKVIKAARQAALPVADESKGKVKWLIYRLNHEKEWRNSNWHPDRTKEYTIEAECREDVDHFLQLDGTTTDTKVLVLL